MLLNWRIFFCDNEAVKTEGILFVVKQQQQQQQQQVGRSTQDGSSGSRRVPTPPRSPPPSLTGDCGDPDYEVIEFPVRSQNSTTPNNSRAPLSTAAKNSSPELKNVSVSSNNSNSQKCALCGTKNLFARCDTCKEFYCETCDDVNHKHPKRRGHTRRRIAILPQDHSGTMNQDAGCRTRPPLPPKGETNANPPPVPPPRRNRRNTQVGCALA